MLPAVNSGLNQGSLINRQVKTNPAEFTRHASLQISSLIETVIQIHDLTTFCGLDGQELKQAGE